MEETKLTKTDYKKANTVLEELFARVGIEGTFELIESESTIDVVLDTKDTGIVIGYHGEILEALQLIASLMVAKKIGKFARVSIDVGDYKKNRSEYLERLAEQAKERAMSEGKEQELSNLKSWERRVVHMHLQDDDAVTSESVGEGRDRRLIVKPKN